MREWNTACVVLFSRTSDRSSPAQNAGPSPSSTAARAVSGRDSKHSRSSRTRSSLSALRLAERHSVIFATAPTVSMLSNGVSGFWLIVLAFQMNLLSRNGYIL